MTEKEEEMDEKKLPRWAQDKLRALREQVENLQAEVVTLRGQPGRSETAFSRTYGTNGLARPVPLVSDTVEFRLPGGRVIQAYVRDGWLRLMLTTPGPLSVRPDAANVIGVGGTP